MQTRMLAMNNDTTAQQVIPKPKTIAVSMTGVADSLPSQFQDRVLDILPKDPDNMLLSFDREGNGQELNVYKVNVYNGYLRGVLEGGANVASYISDADGNVRVRWRFRHAQKDFVTELTGDNGRSWSIILNKETDGLGRFDVEGFGDSGDELYVSGYGKDGRREISVMDLASSTVGEPVASHESYDIEGLLWGKSGNRIVGYTYTDHQVRDVYFDPEWRQVQKAVDAGKPDTNNEIVSRDNPGEKWVIFVSGEQDPGSYWLYLRSTGQLMEIARTYPDLKDHLLRPVEVFDIEARDGLTIPGYLTRPAGSGPFPTVVMPHGGPNARDTMGFDYWRQFLASRGYAVYQPNFRGSDGFGQTFREAGHHEWGLKMQDDVTDGTKALIETGVAAADRLCIVGASYGGYAALMGAVKEPDLYQCAVSFGGVTDVAKFLNHQRNYKFDTGNDPRIGDRFDDRGRIRDTSPANNVDAIKVPVLLVHGENDLRVLAEHSKLMAKRLRRAKKSNKLVILEDGDHHLSRQDNRILFLKELEAFLIKNIGR